MRVLCRVGLLTLFCTMLGAAAVQAAPINVAEFRWDVLSQPGIPCAADDVSCVPEDPFSQSIFTLTNIWDGPGSDVTLFDNQLVLPTGNLAFFDVSTAFLANFDQLQTNDIPAAASTSVSFIWDGAIVSLQTTLNQPDTFAVLQFDPTPVPEPGTSSLLAFGIVGLAARARTAAVRRQGRRATV
jgi:hypothetical protein